MDEETITFQVGETIEIEAAVKWKPDISPVFYEVVLKVNGEFHDSVSVDMLGEHGEARAPFTLSFVE